MDRLGGTALSTPPNLAIIGTTSMLERPPILCWDPIGKRLFVSMDVTFCELELYYTNKDDLDSFLEECTSVPAGDCTEGESENVGGVIHEEEVVVGTVPCPMIHEEVVVGTILCPMNEPTAQETVARDTAQETVARDTI